MNKASRFAAAINSAANPFQLKACFIHSTPVLERRKGNNWHSWDSYSPPKRSRRRKNKTSFRNVDDVAARLFQNWRSMSDDDQPSSQQNSWYRPNFNAGGYSKANSRKNKSKAGTRIYEFCDLYDDIEFEDIFRSAFGGGNRSSFRHFVNFDDDPGFRSYRTYGRGRYEYDEEYDSSSESDEPVRDNYSDRQTLGLSASGPLSIEDVKNAYRVCALKWHPDRHQGSSKVAAEEKFKVCSAAYQSLCDKMAMGQGY